MADIRVAGKNCIYVSCEFSSLVLVNRMCNVCGGSLYMNPPPDAGFGGMMGRAASILL